MGHPGPAKPVTGELFCTNLLVTRVVPRAVPEVVPGGCPANWAPVTGELAPVTGEWPPVTGEVTGELFFLI